MPPLDPAKWAHNSVDAIDDAGVRSARMMLGAWGALPGSSIFKHAQPFEPNDIWRMRVVAGGSAQIGCVGDAYDVSEHWGTIKRSSWLNLYSGATVIYSDSGINKDGESDQLHGGRHHEDLALRINKDIVSVYSGRILHSGQHFSRGHNIRPHTPQAPFDLALRCAAVSNMPQIQFNDDGVWHDFAPEGRTALMPGPWFPGLILRPGDCLRDHCLDEPARVPRLPLSPVLTCQLDGGFTPISSEQPDSSN